MNTTKTQLFSYGSPVTGGELIGREPIIQQILQDLRGGQNLLLPGPRRTGKSSVILESLHRLSKEGFLTAYIDISSVNSKQELAREIVAATLAPKNSRLQFLIKSIASKLKDLLKFKEYKLAYNNFEFIATLHGPQNNEEELIKDAFDFLDNFALGYNKKLICAFDEFGELKTIDVQLIKKMRAKFQRHNRCTYIFSGSQESIMRDIFENPKEPFFGFTKNINLPSINTHEFAAYIQKKFQEASFNIEYLISRELCRWVDTHPFYTKVLANSVYEYAALNNLETIDESVLLKGFQKAFLNLKSQLEGQWIELGKPSRFLRKVCTYIALYPEEGLFLKEGLKQNVESAHIAQALRSLEDKGILRKVKRGHYVFENYFLKEYILSLINPRYLEEILPPTNKNLEKTEDTTDLQKLT